MKKQEIKTIRYTLKRHFFVDVMEVGESVEFWLGNEGCDVRELMFAASAQFAPAERYESMIEENAEDYLEDFADAYLTEE